MKTLWKPDPRGCYSILVVIFWVTLSLLVAPLVFLFVTNPKALAIFFLFLMSLV